MEANTLCTLRINVPDVTVFMAQHSALMIRQDVKKKDLPPDFTFFEGGRWLVNSVGLTPDP